jgi:hypothetical protein
MTEFNLPLLRKAVEWAESEAAKPVEESEWCQHHFAAAGQDLGRNCGTAYCIAGWTVHEHAQGDHNLRPYSIDGDGSAGLAQELLGIDPDDAWGGIDNRGLFCASNTIENVRTVAERIARKYGEEL